MKSVTCLTSLFLLTLFSLSGQNGKNVCDEGDCASAILGLEIVVPSGPAVYSQARTDAFIEAFEDFEKAKASYANSPDWKADYEAFNLGGKSCLHHYRLEETFGDEYLNNPGFKQYIDAKGGSSTGFVRKSFESSRRGLNLAKRMEKDCPEKAKEDKPGAEQRYMGLGKELGYFDAAGNPLKPLDPPAVSNEKLSKKEQIEKWKEDLAKMPIPAMQQQLTQLSNALGKAQEGVTSQAESLNALAGSAAKIIPDQSLTTGVGTVVSNLNTLPVGQLKFVGSGLLSKVKNLLGKAKNLKDIVANALKGGKAIQNKISKLKDKIIGLQKSISDKKENSEKLKDELAGLEKEKDALAAKLEDKPKKIFEELKAQMSGFKDKLKDMQDKISDARKGQKQAEEDLNKTEGEKDRLTGDVESAAQKIQDLKKQLEDLQQQATGAEQEVEKAQQSEDDLTAAAENLENTPATKDLQEQLKICDEDLQKMYDKLTTLQSANKDFMTKLAGAEGKFDQVSDKIAKAKSLRENLEKSVESTGLKEKLGRLKGRVKIVDNLLNLVGGKLKKIKEKAIKVKDSADGIKNLFQKSKEKTQKGQTSLANITKEKEEIFKKIENATGKADAITEQINDLLKRIEDFSKETDCDAEELEKQREQGEEEQKTGEEELKESEENLNEADRETEDIQRDLEEIESLEQRKAEIKEEFGQDLDLRPVEPQEWAESFEIKREYWDAVFHPDEEVVEGFKGRYFEIRLKDAEKNVKLLFGPGEYFMEKSDFREQYGSVIGAFVTEALHALRKDEQAAIQLFVQGSADITGQNTFRGNLDERFSYEELTVLPQKDGPDNFSSTPAGRSVPQTGFTNDDLPNLRGNFLKEMISVYSKKLSPVLLEGAVTKVKDKGDRNAVIYLFIPAVDY